MDCNKEEATWAKKLAENKMQKGDFIGAEKLVLKAQGLFPSLDGLQHMLAICDVHSSAENKFYGLENWYDILQVLHFSDDDTIKKQYRKLALLLHPDKNRFPGAEAAFKLLTEANKFLADKEKRTQYDIKRRIYSRFLTKQRAAANNASGSIVSNGTFWTCCEHCGYRYKYSAEFVNTLLYCSGCQRSYMAYKTGFNGVLPKSSTDQKEVRNQGPCNTSLQKNVESNGAQPGNAAAEVDKKGTVEEKLNKKKGGGKNKYAEVRETIIEAGSMKNSAQLSKPEKGEEKMKNNAELPKADALDPQSEATKSETGESVSRSDQAPSVSKEKNKSRKFVEDPIESVDGSDTVEHQMDSKDNNKRRSQRKRQQISNAEKRSSDDFVNPPTKKSKSSVGSSKRSDSGDASAPSCVSKGKAKKKVDSGYQEISATKGKESKGCKDSGERVVMAGEIGSNLKANEKLITQDLPDPDFNDFELKTSCYAVNQVWSLYDSRDGMPRFYARIIKVFNSEFKLLVTWIDPLQDKKDNSIPIACGIFQDGDSEELDDHLMFSSQMLHLPDENNTVIYPRKGEIWAVFRGWDISWSDSSENHKRPYEYDYVEILSDFKDDVGLGVACLGKVEGFVSLFCRAVQHGVLQFLIPPTEMLRFSHKAPSFKMTGKERQGVPPGCFELDTAALPKDLFEVEMDRERTDGKTGGHFPEASKAKTTPESSSSPKKRQKVHDNHGSFSKASDGKCTNHEMKSPKKSRKSVKAVDDSKLRKSPRFFSKTNNQATSGSSPKTAEKKSATNGESCEQPNEFCISGEKMTTSKKAEKVITTGSSRIRKSPRDIQHNPTGNSKKHGRNDESLSQSRGNGSLTRSNGAIKCSDPETHVPSSCTTRQENSSNLEKQRSWDEFQVDQIWAIYSNAKGMPRKYAQIKRIDTSPEFKLHVAPLVLHHPPKLMTHPVCCGCFKLKTGTAEVLLPSSFSHQIKFVKININRFEVYPGKGEIWALYKNLNTTDCAESEEVEFVEIVETEDEIIQAAPLTPKGFNKLLYGWSEESNVDFVDIPMTEVSRFSHQIPARATQFGGKECWELDPKAVPGL